MTSQTMHCLIRGRVQGVSFRAYTRLAARQLGLNGWVRNLHDGRVEVMVTGDKELLLRLLGWLPEGVPAGRVDAIVTDWLKPEPFSDFTILADAEEAYPLTDTTDFYR